MWSRATSAISLAECTDFSWGVYQLVVMSIPPCICLSFVTGAHRLKVVVFSLEAMLFRHAICTKLLG